MTLGGCHVCISMTAPHRKHAGESPNQGVEFCRLCKRSYCLKHKSTTEKSAEVCEIKHQTYAGKHAKVMNGWTIFRDVESRKAELKEEGVKEEEERINNMIHAQDYDD